MVDIMATLIGTGERRALNFSVFCAEALVARSGTSARASATVIVAKRRRLVANIGLIRERA
jgi:hypothetical protein